MIKKDDIEKLKEARDILSRMNYEFKLENIIYTDSNSILVFTHMCPYIKEDSIKKQEEILKEKFKHECIILPRDLKLEKVISISKKEE